MFRLVCIFSVAGAILAIPMATAAQAPEVSLSASSFQVRYGDSIHLSGMVSNNEAGVSLGIFARSFRSAGFTRIATVTTGADGGWTYDVKPGIATTYQARTSGNESSTLLVGVRPAVSLSKMANGGLAVNVDAVKYLAGRFVKFQRLDSGAWSTLAKLRLNLQSRALVPAQLVPLEGVPVRATMSVNQAGPGYLGGFSPPMKPPLRWVSLAVSSPEIVYGDPLEMSGQIAPNRAGLPMTILARSATKAEFQPLATLTTGTGGRWSFSTHPRIGTIYEAQYAGATSPGVGVGVRPSTKVRIMSGGRVWTQIAAGHSLKGRSVQVQQLTDGQWLTVAKAPLNGRSVAIFPASMLPGGASTLRVAMSVNQAGAGYLGAFSRSFIYQR